MTAAPLDPEAPSGDEILAYDRWHLLTYAELLDAADAGIGWEAGSLAILGIDPATDAERARSCWDSHLARARWITGAGLVRATAAFGAQARAALFNRRRAPPC